MLGGQLSPSLCSHLLSPIALQAPAVPLDWQEAGWARSRLAALPWALQPLHPAPRGAAGGRCSPSPAPPSLAFLESPSPPPKLPVPRLVQITPCYTPGMSRETPQALRSQHRLPQTALLEVSFAGPWIYFIALNKKPLYSFSFLETEKMLCFACTLLLFGWVADIPC